MFLIFALFYKRYVDIVERPLNGSNATKMLLDSKNVKVIENKKNVVEEWKGLYLFTTVQNSFLYTYSMLLQVSLPSIPMAWSLRIFIGWWWIFSILITVTYKASMTATLANSIDR